MFGEVIVHIASGNIYAAKAGMGEKVKWDDQEPDPAKYATRPACVALLKKSIEDANAALKANPKGPRRTCSLFCRCCSAVPNTMVCWSRTIGPTGWFRRSRARRSRQRKRRDLKLAQPSLA